jgi:hypothetical protein
MDDKQVWSNSEVNRYVSISTAVARSEHESGLPIGVRTEGIRFFMQTEHYDDNHSFSLLLSKSIFLL